MDCIERDMFLNQGFCAVTEKPCRVLNPNKLRVNHPVVLAFHIVKKYLTL